MPLLRYERGRANCPRRIYIATPVGDSKPFENYTASVPSSVLALADAGISADFAIESGNVHVDDARNALVRHFLTTDCTDLVFIDADVGWRPQDLVRLVSVDRDIVAGIYPKKQDRPEFPVYLRDGPLVIDDDGLLEVERVPTGFLRIRRRVLETLAASVPQFRGQGASDDEPLYPLIFERSCKDGRRWSGDYEFCNKAKAAGFRIHVDPEMQFSHAGMTVYYGCLGDHLRQKAGLDHPDFVGAVEQLREGKPTAETWLRLARHWSNPWAATPEMLFVAWQAALNAKGPILETGSGLSTLVLGIAAQHSGQIVFSLEHDPDWYDRIAGALGRYDVTTVRLDYAPLQPSDYHQNWWYNVDPIEFPNFALVLCDGPPRQFGRQGLFALLGSNIRDAHWLIDDADDPAQMTLINRYATGRRIETVKTVAGKSFAIAACQQQAQAA